MREKKYEKTTNDNLVIVILIIDCLSGCNEQTPEEGTAPIINFFTVTPATVIFGNSSVLNWSVTGATSVSIDNGIGNVTFSGSKTIVPIQNQTYTLTAFNSYGSTNASVKVYVRVISENTSSDEEKIIGAWSYSSNYNNNTFSAIYIFLSNKTLDILAIYNGEPRTRKGTWSLTDNKLFMIFEDQTIPNDYKFSDNNTKLAITDSSGTAVFTKQ